MWIAVSALHYRKIITLSADTRNVAEGDPFHSDVPCWLVSRENRFVCVPTANAKNRSRSWTCWGELLGTNIVQGELLGTNIVQGERWGTNIVQGELWGKNVVQGEPWGTNIVQSVLWGTNIVQGELWGTNIV